MMKKITCIIGLLLSGLAAQAQSGYTFSYSTGNPYTPLSSGTNISAGVIWDDENWAIPMGFSLDIGGKTVSDFLIYDNEYMPSSDTEGVVNCFVPLSGSDWADRGLVSGSPSSPIRYTISGSSPSRIFKLEYANAGFFTEYQNLGTMDDSVNFQVWVYETSGIVEYYYGDSHDGHSGASFLFGGPLSGYMKEANMDALSVTMAFGVRNDPSAPVYDSTNNLFSIPSLSRLPTKGTMYRYTPLSATSSVSDPELSRQFRVYPTQTAGPLYISNNNRLQAALSISDLNGRVLRSGIELQQSNQLDLSGLPSGMYLLHIRTAAGVASYRFNRN